MPIRTVSSILDERLSRRYWKCSPVRRVAAQHVMPSLSETAPYTPTGPLLDVYSLYVAWPPGVFGQSIDLMLRVHTRQPRRSTRCRPGAVACVGRACQYAARQPASRSANGQDPMIE